MALSLILRPKHSLAMALRVICPPRTTFTEGDDSTREYVLTGLPDSKEVKGVDAICRSVRGPFSVPRAAVDDAALSEWTYFALHAADAVSVDVGALRNVANRLLKKTFLADTAAPSFCDILVYAAVRSSVCANSVSLLKETSYFPLYRWIATLEALPEVKPLVTSTMPMPTLEKEAAPPKAAEGSAGGAAPSGKPTAEQLAVLKAQKEAEKKKKEAEKPVTAAPAPALASEAPLNPAQTFDIRVGYIKECKKHPDADGLFLESIDLGEPSGPRQVVSGLVKWTTAEALTGRQVLVMCNLKPSKMRGVESQGMVMCAVNATDTELEVVTPPEGSRPGDVVAFPGFEGSSQGPPGQINPKKLQEFMSGLKTNENGVPCWMPGGLPMTLPKGTMKTKIANGVVR